MNELIIYFFFNFKVGFNSIGFARTIITVKFSTVVTRCFSNKPKK